MKPTLIFVFSSLVVACPAIGDEPHKPADESIDSQFRPHPDGKRWAGVYASTSEVGIFTSTVLVIDDGSMSYIGYDMKFTTDVVSDDNIQQDRLHGAVLTEENRIYIPVAHGSRRKGKISLMATIFRYTRIEIDGKVVLLRDDALEAYEKEKKLYGYGVLIRVADYPGMFGMLDFDRVKHPSIKSLYKDKTKGTSDPFTSGLNDGG
ncbi:MAG: hypothetical protein AAF958_09780 [Planctomycetota bacterium]